VGRYMQTILVAGVLNQPFGSWPVASQSYDGITWTNFSIPFNTNECCTGIATDGVTVAISNQRGDLAITTNMDEYSSVIVNDGFGITDIAQSLDANGYNHWLTVGSYNYINGYGPYPPQTEVAQIYQTTSPTSAWAMVFTHPTNGSLFYQVNYFVDAPVIYGVETANTWVAVGFDGISDGDIWYSLDYGTSWTRALVPKGVGTIYSVALYQLDGIDVWYWGCNGKFFISSDLHSTLWNEIALNIGDTAVGIVAGATNAIVVNGVNNLYISVDGLRFITFSQPGYVFNNVVVFQHDNGYRWVVFARSTLTQYTMWYTDNLTTWLPWNNGIEVQGSCVNT